MRTITADDVSALLASFSRQFPGFQLVTKPFTSDRCTTWDTTVCVPTTWEHLTPAWQYIRLTHEAIHLRQFQDLGIWWFSARWASLFGRKGLECPAYAAEYTAVAGILGMDALREKRSYYLDLLTGSAYGWMWALPPGAASAWFDMIVAQLAAENTPV